MNENLEVKEKSNKNIIIFAIIGIVLVVILLVVLLPLIGGSKKEENNKNEIVSSIKEMGKKYFEEYLYPESSSNEEERTEFLSKYTDIGIKVSLENLGRNSNFDFQDEIDKFENNKTKEKCNQVNSRIIIYPKTPYGRTDYELEVVLDCGFDEE